MAVAISLMLLPSMPAGAQAETVGSGWRQLSAGLDNTCGIRAGRLYCWGSDQTGVLGNGYPLANRGRPVEAAGGFTDWRTVSVGQAHACAIRSGGRLYCWGGDGHGQLGDGAPLRGSARPVEVVGPPSRWRAVSAGFGHTCATTIGNRLYCWGSGDDGQLGRPPAPDGEPVTQPVQVDGGTADWRSVSAGRSVTCGIRLTGQAFCWGSNSSGQLGSGGPNLGGPTPVEVAGGAGQWATIDTGAQSACGVGADARLYCWGSDSNGQLGNGATTTGPQPTPVEVAGETADWRSVQVGALFACATKVDGRLFCWGSGGAGQLGNGAEDDHPGPAEVTGETTDWRSISTGSGHACGRRTGGRAFCWGYDAYNQLGNGPTRFKQLEPVPVG